MVFNIKIIICIQNSQQIGWFVSDELEENCLMQVNNAGKIFSKYSGYPSFQIPNLICMYFISITMTRHKHFKLILIFCIILYYWEHLICITHYNYSAILQSTCMKKYTIAFSKPISTWIIFYLITKFSCISSWFRESNTENFQRTELRQTTKTSNFCSV